MSYEKKQEIVSWFGGSGNNYDVRFLAYDLRNMILKFRNMFYDASVYEKHFRWVMTHDTFIWIITKAKLGEYDFNYEIKFDCTKPIDDAAIMGIDIVFINDEYMSLNRIVKLSYVEPDTVVFERGMYFDTDTLTKAFDSMQYLVRNVIEANKEKKSMKSFYVGYGKKVTIENVIFNNPATIVFWSDGTKTVVKRQKGDKKFDPEKGLAMAICKKMLGNKGNFNDIFKEWIEED